VKSTRVPPLLPLKEFMAAHLNSGNKYLSKQARISRNPRLLCFNSGPNIIATEISTSPVSPDLRLHALTNPLDTPFSFSLAEACKQMADPSALPSREEEDFSEDNIEDDQDSDLPSFDISLVETGDDGSSFRTENDPSAPFQRSNYVERKGAIDIRCSCLDVIHGQFSSESGVFATLIVLQFRFDARKRARRFQSADISLEFKGMKPGESGPEVYGIAPVGKMSLVPTTQTEAVTRKAGLQIGAAAPTGGITATGSVGWKKCVTRDTSDDTTVIGSIDLKGRNWGPSNCASWTLLENETAKTGIPSSIRTAILLKRKDEMPFQCVVKIDALVDAKSRLERMFGGKGREPKDDPVLFDPEIEPTNKLRKYALEELGSFDLESVCDVTMTTMLNGVVKDKS